MVGRRRGGLLAGWGWLVEGGGGTLRVCSRQGEAWGPDCALLKRPADLEGERSSLSESGAPKDPQRAGPRLLGRVISRLGTRVRGRGTQVAPAPQGGLGPGF